MLIYFWLSILNFKTNNQFHSTSLQKKYKIKLFILGDLFSCHAVDNPSLESEVSLLKQYGPNVPDAIILRIVKAFGELRAMADEGLLQYPYSTREVVNIVKHLQVIKFSLVVAPLKY